MSRFEVSRAARMDIDEIVDYVAVERPTAARRLFKQFQTTFEFLADRPQVGEDLSRLIVGLRRFTTSRYVVYFEPTQFGVCIVRVFDGARDHENLL